MKPEEAVKHVAKHGGLKAAHRALGVQWGSSTALYKAHKEAVRLGLVERPRAGKRAHNTKPATKQRVKAMKALRLTPPKGTVKRYIITSAQNNTALHKGLWANLLALKDHYNAELMVSTFVYYKHSLGQEGMQKVKGERGDASKYGITWPEEILPYRFDQRAKIARGLVFCGELNIIPTAARPLSGLEVYTGRHSMIVPHAKLALESIATVGGRGTKFNYTTGAVTLRNYIQRKEGFKSEFHHCYGALLVEVDESGHWWVRQLNGDSKGTIYDLTLKAEDGVVTDGHCIEAINFGDTHVEEIDKQIAKATWGEGGVVDTLRPKYQIHNDLLDFHRRSHHAMKDTFKMFTRFVQKRDCVETEVRNVLGFLHETARDFSETVVVDSNHDRFIAGWLNGTDARRDPINAYYWADLLSRVYAYQREHDGQEPILLELALRSLDATLRVKFIDSNTSFVMCKDSGGGIECGLHGDRGANGARGNIRSFARMGRRSNTGHSHVAGICDGAMSAGTKSKLRLEYNSGPSSWSHSDIVTYVNGKRAILTYYAGKAWA